MNKNYYLPGLPSVEDLPYRYPFTNSSRTKIIPVLSYNYDYLPMYLESPKVFWIDLNGPAPPDLEIRKPVRLLLDPSTGINTFPGTTWNSVFYVDDIIGSRVVLLPYKESNWLPTMHQPITNPFGWGYTSTTVDVSPSMRSTKYGFGAPVASLEYYPNTYSVRSFDYA